MAADDPRILVAHDGEIEDVCGLLRELGSSFEEQRGRPPARAGSETWDLVVATPQRLLERRLPRGDARTHRIAVMDRGTRTLSAMLRRAGVELVVRRPVHPAALRLAIVRALYGGPERRRRERVSVGAPVSFRSGLLPRRAVLAELSNRGARLLTSHAVRRDSRLRLRIPADVTATRPLDVRARVVRTGPASGEEAGTQAVAVVFEDVSRELLSRLQTLVAMHLKGPATWQRGTPPPLCRRTEPAAAAESGDAGERRQLERRGYDQKVIALSEEAARILMGRDLSRGGMRVDPHPDLAVGDQLRLAVHSAGHSAPLVVVARVDRDDGPAGSVLRFQGLDSSARDALDKLIHDLPFAEPVEDGGEGEGRVLSEIVERDD